MVIRPDKPPAELELIDTVSAVIAAVGGTGAAQRLTRKKTPQVVVNWRARGRFPAATYPAFQTELAARGKRAPSALWGIPEPTLSTTEHLGE